MKLIIELEVEVDNYISPVDIVNAVQSMLEDHRWRKVAWATAPRREEEKRHVPLDTDIFIKPETVRVKGDTR